MAQHDMNIANQGFPATRADLNNALQALVSNSSGATAPSTTFANQWWYDTTNNKMYLRNEANNAWIEVAVLDQTNNEWKITTGVVQAKDSDGLALKTDDGTTRLFIRDSDGHIGINTTSPTGELTVQSSTAGSYLINLDYADGTDGGGFYQSSADDLSLFIKDSSGNTDVSITSGGDTYFNNGDFSIGTNSPQNSAKLTVLSGKINAGTASSVGGSVILEGYYTAGSLSNWGSVASSGGAAMMYGAHPKTGAQTTFTSSTSIALSRTAYVCEDTFKWYTGASQTVAIGSDLSMSERMRLNGDGNLLINTTNTNYGEKFKLVNNSSSGNCMFLWHNNTTDRSLIIMRNNAASGAGFNTMLDFLDSGGGSSGSIKISSTTTQYNTSSDYRLKENITDVTDGITRLKQLSPRRFNWISDESNTLVDGFIAHEAQTVVPEAVSGTKDGMKDEEYEVSAATGDIYTPAVEATYDDDGNELTAAIDEVIHSADVAEPETLADGQYWRETTAAEKGTRSVPDYQGIDQAKLVPLLTAALQEAIAKIEALETRVAALEG